jgi:hypothetical protein
MRCTIVTGPPSAGDFSLHDEGVVCDPTYATHRTYAADEPSLYLVRPDGYVAFRSRLRSASKLVESMRRNFVALH